MPRTEHYVRGIHEIRSSDSNGTAGNSQEKKERDTANQSVMTIDDVRWVFFSSTYDFFSSASIAALADLHSKATEASRAQGARTRTDSSLIARETTTRKSKENVQTKKQCFCFSTRKRKGKKGNIFSLFFTKRSSSRRPSSSASRPRPSP